ncbi:MAG: hypothetical protein PHR96_00300 [Clostridia bacterium]|nr:hypothetical protein [Clostridia bacterium]
MSRKNKEKLSKAKGGKFFVIFSCFISIALCVALADLFSTFITVGSFAGVNGGKINAYSIYAVELHQSSIKSSALEQATVVKKIGGAGYVWESEGVFYVIASAYIEENDATKVKENLIESGYTAEILKIDFCEISIGRNYSAEELSALSSALNLFKNTYKNLYDISISLDTLILTETQCRLEIANIQSDVSKKKSDFEALFNSKLTPNLLQIKLSMNSLSTLIQQLIDYVETTTQPFGSKMKYNYMEILLLHKTLSLQLTNL